MEQSKTEFTKVTIEEFYTKDDDGVVWWHYRLSGRPWNVEKTYLVDLPFTVFGQD